MSNEAGNKAIKPEGDGDDVEARLVQALSAIFTGEVVGGVDSEMVVADRADAVEIEALLRGCQTEGQKLAVVDTILTNVVAEFAPERWPGRKGDYSAGATNMVKKLLSADGSLDPATGLRGHMRVKQIINDWIDAGEVAEERALQLLTMMPASLMTSHLDRMDRGFCSAARWVSYIRTDAASLSKAYFQTGYAWEDESLADLTLDTYYIDAVDTRRGAIEDAGSLYDRQKEMSFRGGLEGRAHREAVGSNLESLLEQFDDLLGELLEQSGFDGGRMEPLEERDRILLEDVCKELKETGQAKGGKYVLDMIRLAASLGYESAVTFLQVGNLEG